MKISSLIIVLMLLAIPFGFADDACTTNEDCTDGVCLEDACVECAQDSDCEDGYMCDDNECEATEETNDEELDEEIEHMDSQEAAEYRLEQFALSLENHIEHAKDILAQVEVDEDVMDELEGYVAQLELVLDKVQDMEPTGTPAEMAADFIALKREAWNITRDFRTTLHGALASDRVQQIRAAVREMQQQRLEVLKTKLQERRENMYTRYMSHMLARTGMNQEDIADKLESGELTREQARDMLREQLADITEEQRSQLRQRIVDNREEIRQALDQAREQARDRIREMTDAVQEEYQTRLQERRDAFAEEIQQRRDELRQKMADDTTGDPE